MPLSTHRIDLTVLTVIGNTVDMVEVCLNCSLVVVLTQTLNLYVSVTVHVVIHLVSSVSAKLPVRHVVLGWKLI